MRIYCDPSFLIAVYVSEGLSASVHAYLQKDSPLIAINSVQEYEFRNSVRQKVFRGEITESELARCLSVYQADFVAQKLRHRIVPWNAALSEAERLSHRLSQRQSCRSYDLLHVAIARVSNANPFATLDAGQAALAEAAGLKVVTFS